METDKKRAFVYERFSHEIQRGNSSEERQERFSDQVIKELNLEVVDTLLDDGVSARDGLNLESGRFSELYDLVQAGDYIIIEGWSRYSRAEFDFAHPILMRLVREKDVKLYIGRDEDGELVEINKKNRNTS